MEKELFDFIKNNSALSSGEIFIRLEHSYSYSTLKRMLTKLLESNHVITEGKGKGTKYLVSPAYELLEEIDVEQYFSKEQDERIINNNFNFSLIPEVLRNAHLFTKREEQELEAFQLKFKTNIASLSATAYGKEMERLAIDLSWKSSQIEGNTYSLLETERLLKEQETAQGKPKDDAIMLLNHKEAINFIIAHPEYVVPLTVRPIEDIHSILTKELNVDGNIRQRRVGITGTNYKPLDNEHQIREAFENMCMLVNVKENIFEKSLLVLALLSYIQAFNDGNKRTARIISNALLIAHQYCPISFRTVDSVEYKKAMLIFYELNNISAFKRIFIEQFKFSVNTYF
ncbi:Fic family protein [Arachidicoccus sp.]|uniref:Fic family protein n=1 Tax=Arachidicoccus sp. TaxID=1872624 RepID=UPI003D19044F